MTDERYKKIMADLGMPNSRSLLVALQQVANEAGQECAAAEREACAKVCDDAASSLVACPKSEKNEAAISALKQQALKQQARMIRSRSNAMYPAKPACSARARTSV